MQKEKRIFVRFRQIMKITSKPNIHVLFQQMNVEQKTIFKMRMVYDDDDNDDGSLVGLGFDGNVNNELTTN